MKAGEDESTPAYSTRTTRIRSLSVAPGIRGKAGRGIRRRGPRFDGIVVFGSEWGWRMRVENGGGLWLTFIGVGDIVFV